MTIGIFLTAPQHKRHYFLGEPVVKKPDKSEFGKSMRPMDLCDGPNVCFEISDIVTLQDYDKFMVYVKSAMETYGSFNLLFYYTSSFRGWEPAAADANMQAILEYGSGTKRLAYVNPPEKKIMQHKIAPDLFGGEMKYFTEAQLEEALEWVCTG